MEEMVSWYQSAQVKDISESETKAYLVVPLLRVLGWSPQRMAREWSRIDIALIEDMSSPGGNSGQRSDGPGYVRREDTLACIVEVKQLGASSLRAFQQAEGYAKRQSNTN